MILLPFKKIEFGRMLESNPTKAASDIINLLHEEMKKIIDLEISSLKKEHQLELQKMKQDLKKEIPDLEKVLAVVTGEDGEDGEDSEAEDVAEILLEMPEFMQMVKPRDPKDGETPTKEELLSIIQPLIPVLRQPEDGKTPTTEFLLSLMSRLIPSVEDGHTPTVEELTAIISPLIPAVRDGSPDTGAQIVDKVNALPLDPNFQIDASHIKNLPRVKKDKKSATMRGGGDIAEYYDLSGQTNGVLKVFTIPTNRKIIWVGGTDAPGGQYRQTVDYTGSGTTILTLTSAVAAPTQGGTLHILYIV